jgi:hypothetical protein
MKLKIETAIVACLGLLLTLKKTQAQTNAILFDGVIVAGYVDKGAYVNYLGPSLKFSKKPYSLALGFLPSLRIKEDNVASGATKNNLITPTLGFGITAIAKNIALQVPLYYNTKSAGKDGKWNVGIGIGYKL